MVDDPLYLPVGWSESPSCRIDMTDADIADNQIVLVHVSYGEREKMLGKGLDRNLPLEIASGLAIMIIAGVAIAVIIAAMVLLRRRKK